MPPDGSPCSKEIDAMRQILHTFVKVSEDCWNKRIDLCKEKLLPEALENREFLIKWLHPDKWEKLDSLITDACRKKTKLRAHDVGTFYLPPIVRYNREFIPVFNLEADFSNNANPEVLIRVAMLTYDKQTAKLRVFGYRFETPHANSIHDFCHAQFTRDPLGWESKNSESCEMIAKWSPEHIPSMLAPARGPAGLLVWMIVGLYGKTAFSFFSTLNIDPCFKEPLRYLSTNKSS
jgi:hypothetical protein